MNLQSLKAIFDANNVKTLTSQEIWQAGTAVATVTIDGTDVKFTSGGIRPQLLIKIDGVNHVIEIDKASITEAARGHANWTLKQCTAVRSFEGVALTNGKLVSREEFSALVASGDSSAVVDTNRSDKGLVRISAGDTKIVAFPS